MTWEIRIPLMHVQFSHAIIQLYTGHIVGLEQVTGSSECLQPGISEHPCIWPFSWHLAHLLALRSSLNPVLSTKEDLVFLSDAPVSTGFPDVDSSSAFCSGFPRGCFMIILGCFFMHCDCQLTARVPYVIFDPLTLVESLINSWFFFVFFIYFSFFFFFNRMGLLLLFLWALLYKLVRNLVCS